MFEDVSGDMSGFGEVKYSVVLHYSSAMLHNSSAV